MGSAESVLGSAVLRHPSDVFPNSRLVSRVAKVAEPQLVAFALPEKMLFCRKCPEPLADEMPVPRPWKVAWRMREVEAAVQSSRTPVAVRVKVLPRTSTALAAQEPGPTW